MLCTQAGHCLNVSHRESPRSSSAILSSFPGSSALEREIELVHAEYISRSGEPGNEATAILEYVEWEFPLLLTFCINIHSLYWCGSERRSLTSEEYKTVEDSD